ncbi:hypothetical protein ACWC9R_11895 [Streptomyces sp. NPDC001219]
MVDLEEWVSPQVAGLPVAGQDVSGELAVGATASMAFSYAPANRYHGLSREDVDLLATVADTTIEAVQTAHKADLDDWAREQQLRDHPDLAVLDTDLDRSALRL